MTLHEIENMSFADLKENRVALIESMKLLSAKELAERYLQARTDAKQRDEKLSEQGRTIESLQDGLDVLKESRDITHAKVLHLYDVEVLLKEENRIVVRENKDQVAKAAEDIAACNEIIEVKTGIIERLKVQADKYAAAVSGIHKLSLDAINSQAIEDAEAGR